MCRRNGVRERRVPEDRDDLPLFGWDWRWEGELMGCVPTALAWALIGVLAACGIWDVVTLIFDLPCPTVSDQFFPVVSRYPILPLLIGLLLGHLIWRALPPGH